MAQRMGTGDGSIQHSPIRDRGDAVAEQDVAHTAIERVAPTARRRSRRRSWWLLAVIVAGAAVAAWLLVNNDGAAETTLATTELRFEEVVVADLSEEESYDATLGSPAADPIRTQLSGTVTAVVPDGATVEEGDVLFAIDGAPVVLLYGEVPAYRDLLLAEETIPGLTNRISGTVTALSEPGIFEQGEIMYWVDAEPVVLLYGDVPAYRTMRDQRGTNMEGEDILQLEIALVDLGYDPDDTVTVDGEYTQKTEEMVERWQDDIGAASDGMIALGDVIFSPGPVEVLDFLVEPGDIVGSAEAVANLLDEADPLEGDDVLQLEAALIRLGFDSSGALVADGVWDEVTDEAVVAWQESVGAEADGIVDLGEVVFLPDPVRVLDQLAPVSTNVGVGTPILDISSADKLVTMNLPAADQGIIAAGDGVTVELPDGTEVTATVLEVASVASIGNNNNTVFEVTIALDDPLVAAGLDQAPVDVLIVTDSALGVMAVPVTALLVLAEGGYAVEVDTGGGGTRMVGVEPGFFSDGLVEVQSSGLQVGDRVVVP